MLLVLVAFLFLSMSCCGDYDYPITIQIAISYNIAMFHLLFESLEAGFESFAELKSEKNWMFYNGSWCTMPTPAQRGSHSLFSLFCNTWARQHFRHEHNYDSMQKGVFSTFEAGFHNFSRLVDIIL